MFWVILAVPLLSSLVILACVLEELQEEKQKAKEEAEFQKKKKEFEENYLTNE